jgi:hypothetical protein
MSKCGWNYTKKHERICTQNNKIAQANVDEMTWKKHERICTQSNKITQASVDEITRKNMNEYVPKIIK